MARKRRRPAQPQAPQQEVTNPPVSEPKRKAWTILFYLCGDNDILDSFVSDALRAICRVGSSPQVHVVVQCDRREGARRYLLPEGPSSDPPSDPDFNLVRVNTGDPAEAVDFLRWGLKRAPSDHVAVIFSGLGINPAYVGEILTPRESRIRTQHDAEDRIKQRLFSICHDQTNYDALEAHELGAILEEVIRQRDNVIDIVGLDMGVAAFTEIAYQLEGLARVLVASQRPLPDAGWPYEKLLTQWYELAENQNATAEQLARVIVDTVCDEYPDPADDVRMVAVQLDALEEIARALDTVALAIMQNLGDWHVLNAVRKAGRSTDWISPEMSSEMATTSKEIPKSANFLPAVDLLQFLENTHTALLREALKTPEEYGQKQRIEHLRNLLANALPLLRPTEQGRASLLLHARPRENRGLSILLPPSRTETQVNAETGPEFSLANSNYLKLRFSQRVHWAALMGAFMLITEKPHTLWRVISSVLADASGPGRDALLQRLVSKSSVIDGLSQQFKSLSSDAALTLSLEPRQTRDNAGDGIEYLLRLESSLTGATVAEQTSRVYQPSVDAALDGLEQLLQDPRGTVDLQKQLESLGRTLGEDLIQRLCDRLHQERDVLRGRSVSVPHLRLQIPRELMRFPWELMHDSRGLLCERFAFGRQVFMETDLARRRSSTKCGVIRALVVGDPHLDAAFADEMQSRYGRRPVQLAGAQSEARTVVEAFHHLADELVGMPAVVVESRIGERVSCMQMREYLRSGQFDIIHYAGHAQFVKSDPEASAWVLSDGMLRAREIRNTLAWTDSPPWLVFANACEAGMDAGASIGKYQGDVFGLATAFINQSVAAYIAPLWPVDDRIATELAVSFYYALLAERLSLGESLYRAKAEVRRWLNERDGDSPDRGCDTAASAELGQCNPVRRPDSAASRVAVVAADRGDQEGGRAAA